MVNKRKTGASSHLNNRGLPFAKHAVIRLDFIKIRTANLNEAFFSADCTQKRVHAALAAVRDR